MSSADFNINVNASTRQAQAALRATGDAAADAADEVKKLREASGDDLASAFQAQADAVEAQAAAMKKANAEARQRLKLEKDMAKLQEMRAANSLSSQFGAAARGALAAAPAAAAAGVGALMGDAAMRGAAWETGQERLRVSAGADFGKLSAAVESLSSQYGTDATALLSQADRLMKAGYTSEQAVKSMESAVVASRGEVEKMEGLLDAIVEAGTRGYLEEDLLGRMDENSIALRTALQEHLNMTKDELDTALAAGQIDVSKYFEVIDELTGKGTTAQKAAEAALKSTGGLVARMGTEWDAMLRNFGSVINDGMVKPLADGVLPALSKVSGFFRELNRDKTEDLISDIAPGYQKLLDAENAPVPAEKTREEIEAEKALQAQLQKNTEEYKALVLAARDARNAANWDALTSAEKRAAIGNATGLGQDVTQAAITEKIRSDSAFAQIAAGETVSTDDLARVQNLTMWREQLAQLEKQEAAEKAQLDRQQEFLRAAEQKRALMEAELAGDREKLTLLKAQEETRRLALQYQQQGGLSESESLRRAAEEVAMTNRVAAARQPAAADATASPLKSKGWINSTLADVGGGGTRIRNYESQAFRVAQKTEQHTSTIATSAKDILKSLNTIAATRQAAVLV